MGAQEVSDYPSLKELRSLLIPAGEGDRWDQGELPYAIFNLESQRALSSCEALLRLAVVTRRSLDETNESRAVALREVLLDLLPKELDHPFCSVLRALAGLEPGTAGRRREERQRIAGIVLGSERHPATARAVRRRVKEDCWAWLFDRLIDTEVKERRELGIGESSLTARVSPLTLPPDLLDPRGIDRREGEDPTNRRQAMRALGGLASMMLAGAHLESLELDRQVEASDLGPATLEQLDLTVERFGLEYLHTPPLAMFEAIRSCRLYVMDLLNGRHTLAERARLYGVAGWLSALLGHLAFDLGKGPAVAYSHSATALHLAAEVDLDELTAWTQGTQAMVAVFDGHPKEAVAFSEAGRQVAPEGSATAVRLWAQEARACAWMGERANAERAMGAAEIAFSNLLQKPTGSIFSFDRPYLPYYGGTVYTWLQEPKRAQECAEQAIILCDGAPADWPVARVMARIDLATSLAQQGELEGAGRLGAEALEICASGRRTDPVAKRLAGFLKASKQHRDVSVFRDLEDQFRALFPIYHDF
jgi:hypothetical protein